MTKKLACYFTPYLDSGLISSLGYFFSLISCVFKDRRKQFPASLLWFWWNAIDLPDTSLIFIEPLTHRHIKTDAYTRQVRVNFGEISRVSFALTSAFIEYLALFWMGWTKLVQRLSKALSAQHVWWIFQAPRSFKATGWSFTRQTWLRRAQTSAFQTITKIFQMTRRRIIILRFVFLLFRQCSVWVKFVYAISSRLFEVFRSGFCDIFASKSVKEYWHFVRFI